MKLPLLDVTFIRLRADLESISEIREHLINTALFTFVALMLPALFVSLIRERTIGWQPVLWVHIAMVMTMFVTYVFRRRISYNVRAGQLLLLLYVSALVGLLNLGLASAGIAILLCFSILSALFFGKIAGRVAALLSAVTMIAVAAATQAGGLVFPFDFNEYIASAGAWLSGVSSLVLVLAVSVSSVVLLIGYLQKLVGELKARSTELEQAVMLLKNQLDRQQEIEQHHSRLLETVSHEFRTPLQIIRSSIYLLARKASQLPEGEDSTWTRKQFSRIEGAVDRTAEMLDQILVLEKMQTLTPHYTEIETRRLLDKCIAAASSLSAGVRIEMQIAENCRVMTTDEQMLQTVVTNLLLNAVKYSQGAGQVEISVQRNASDYQITVRDQGIGIPPDEMEGLGKPFFRASNAVKAALPGLGLGLTVVMLALKPCDGRWKFHSVVGEGTIVTVKLPVRTVGALDQPA